MSGYVGQGFLNNPIQRDLYRCRQFAGIKFFECEVYSYVVGLYVFSNVSAQCNSQTKVVQHRWVKPTGDPTDLVDGLGSDFPQPMSLRLNICQLASVFQTAQAHQNSGQQLSRFVMQLARKTSSFLFLCGQCAFQEEPVHRFGLLDFLGLFASLLTEIGYHQAQNLALVTPKPVKRQIDRNQAPIRAPEVEFASRNSLLSLGKESFASVALCFRN